MLGRGIILLATFLLFPVSTWAAESQWIVVTAPAYREAIGPLCDQRKAQGLRVVVVQTTDVLTERQIREQDASQLRDHVQKLCRDFKGTSYVLFVGAVEGESARNTVPPLKGSISRMKGQPTDHGYGGPGAAVGRFPARTVAEAEAMVRKTLAYERDDKPGVWRRRLTVLAGIPAYNPLVDKLVETQALARFEKLDPSWSGQALYQNPQSRFCVPDTQLRNQALELVQAGQGFTLYLGHSNAEGFWGGGAHFLNREDWARLTIRRGAGIFATFGCNGCQLRGADGEGYGLAAMRNPGGPVAVLGSHGICFAAMVQLAADGLFRTGFAGKQPERLADIWLGLQDGLEHGKIDGVTYSLLDGVDGDKNIPQEVQRQEHLEMFVLLGDPALRLANLPGDVKLRVEGEAAAGRAITVQGELPARLSGGKVRLTLERTPASEPESLQRVPKEAGPQRDQVLLANYRRANQFAILAKEFTASGSWFEVRLDLPEELPWSRLILRAYAATDRAEGQGIQCMQLKEP